MRQFFACILFVTALPFLSGCVVVRVVEPADKKVRVSVVPEGPKRALLAFIDTSKSIGMGITPSEPGKTPWNTAMEQQLNVLFQLFREVEDDETWIELYAIGGQRCEEKYKDQPNQAQDLLGKMKEILQRGPEEKAGTWFTPALIRLAERSKGISERYPRIPIVALFLTDGGVDDVGNAIKTARVAKGACLNVRYVHAAPVQDSQRDRLSKVFAPFITDNRFGYSSTFDMNVGRSRILKALHGETP